MKKVEFLIINSDFWFQKINRKLVFAVLNSNSFFYNLKKYNFYFRFIKNKIKSIFNKINIILGCVNKYDI